jgi:hypothetical protein
MRCRGPTRLAHCFCGEFGGENHPGADGGGSDEKGIGSLLEGPAAGDSHGSPLVIGKVYIEAGNLHDLKDLLNLESERDNVSLWPAMCKLT